MKKIVFALIGSGMALASANAMALGLSATGGEDSVSVEATQSLLPGWQAGLGYYSTDDSGHNTKAYSGSLMFSPWLPGVDLSVGARYQYLDSDYYGDGGGLGLGGSAYVGTPIPRVSVGGYGFYTPEGLTHGDVDESYEYGARARFHIIGGSYVYAGYRYYHADFDDHGGETLDSGPVLGASVGF
ncbi:YfaZ family outer membrane protein [Phytohalomonas tamaricis]|uniref:YfaZ family outer membrane protein n=1 Tax=Phytohalomonas tamaricis TaxID=2081032 RepID=UPI000D0B23D1|nr:YfaZ family outer membrane protein [Phytohalomonas tamaricis]